MLDAENDFFLYGKYLIENFYKNLEWLPMLSNASPHCFIMIALHKLLLCYYYGHWKCFVHLVDFWAHKDKSSCPLFFKCKLIDQVNLQVWRSIFFMILFLGWGEFVHRKKYISIRRWLNNKSIYKGFLLWQRKYNCVMLALFAYLPFSLLGFYTQSHLQFIHSHFPSLF